jgi:hypothetical protein
MLHKRLKLVGYVRLGDTSASGLEQLNAIRGYCRAHRQECITVCTDDGAPGFGLARALRQMKNFDGLITFDATRLVDNQSDTYRSLRPLIESTFMHGHKKFISIADGLENITPAGQEALISALNEWSRTQQYPTPKYDRSNHEYLVQNQP